MICCSRLAVSIIAPALLDSSSQVDQPSAEASTSPAPSPKPQGETQPSNGVPARLTGRHFLGKRETDSDCKVCSHYKRKRGEEEQEEKKKQKTEDVEKPENKTEEAAEDAQGVKSVDENDGENKESENSEIKDCEHNSGTVRRQTSFYCKTCSGEPSLCPVPCFELYHTRLIYKTAPELEKQGEPSE